MSDPDPKQRLAADRSHEDAKAANALFQAAGQSAILINGGASTAILAFSAAEKAVIRITPASLGVSLGFFAVGVVAGALVIGFQAASVQRYAVWWEGEVLEHAEDREEKKISKKNKDSRNKNEKLGRELGLSALVSFIVSIVFFLGGALTLAGSLLNATTTSVQNCSSLPFYLRLCAGP